MDGGMWAAKAWYGTYFAALACLFPYLNLFFLRLGLSTAQIGTIGCLRPLVSFPAGSLWSGAADKTRRHRPVLLLTFAASLVLRLSIAAVGRHGFAPLLAVVVATEAFAAPVTIIVDAAVMAACAQQADYGKQRLWGAVGWGLCSALAGLAISSTGIWAAFAGHAALAAVAFWPTLSLPFGPLHAKLDRQCGGLAPGDGCGEQWDGAHDSSSSKSSMGAAGSPGSASGKYGEAAEDPEDVAHQGAAAGKKGVERFDSALEAQCLLEKQAPGSTTDPSDGGGKRQERQQQQQQQPRVHFWSGLLRLLSNPEAAIFFFQAVVMGFGVGNIEGFLFLYLDELGGSELLMGLSLSVTCAAESLVFYFLPQILRLGIRRCIHAVFAAFLLRMGCYAALSSAPSPWMVLPVEVLHGFTFALAWGGGSAYCAQLSPSGLEATTQGLFQGLYFGLGVGVGSLVGGHVFHRHGAQAVYLVACGVLAAGWLLTSLAQAAVRLLGLRSGCGAAYERVGVLEMNALQECEEARPAA